MSSSFKVFAVDDDPVIRDIIHAILEPDCDVDSFESAEDCAARLETEKPNLILLDVSLPGMDGFTFCRQTMDNPSLADIPVVFVSSHDEIEERVKGYDAGGRDFIVKPFEPEELLRKVLVAKNMISHREALASQLQDAELLSSMVMASMDETGILLQFMSKLIAMDSPREIADGALELLQRYRLEGVVQTRLGSDIHTYSPAGENLPLEVSVIEHVRDQGRIFEFRRRAVHNFEHVTLMVNNLPLSDPDYCGRLRDHLSVAAQGIDSRLKALATEWITRQARQGILSALEDIGNTIMEVRDNHQKVSSDSSRLIVELQETLLNSFYRLGLTDNQEKFLQNMVGDFMSRMVALIDRGSETEQSLQRLSNRLAQLRNL